MREEKGREKGETTEESGRDRGRERETREREREGGEKRGRERERTHEGLISFWGKGYFWATHTPYMCVCVRPQIFFPLSPLSLFGL